MYSYYEAEKVYWPQRGSIAEAKILWSLTPTVNDENYKHCQVAIEEASTYNCTSQVEKNRCTEIESQMLAFRKNYIPCVIVYTLREQVNACFR